MSQSMHFDINNINIVQEKTKKNIASENTTTKQKWKNKPTKGPYFSNEQG